MKEDVVKIVSAYVRKHSIGASELPALIHQVSQSLAGLDETAPAPPAPLTPAVSIRRSVADDQITCLECGWSGKMLRRHLTKHGTNPEDYRARWKLSANYPMTSKNYSVFRADLAKSIGLGKIGKTRRVARK
jgi:predicted transcriptional regulator